MGEFTMDACTDRQLLEELFRRNEIVPKVSTDEDGASLIITSGDCGKVGGYSSFYTDFVFDPEGGLIEINTWE